MRAAEHRGDLFGRYFVLFFFFCNFQFFLLFICSSENAFAATTTDPQQMGGERDEGAMRTKIFMKIITLIFKWHEVFTMIAFDLYWCGVWMRQMNDRYIFKTPFHSQCKCQKFDSLVGCGWCLRRRVELLYMNR